jgi:hypothetical protein
MGQEDEAESFLPAAIAARFAVTAQMQYGGAIGDQLAWQVERKESLRCMAIREAPVRACRS